MQTVPIPLLLLWVSLGVAIVSAETLPAAGTSRPPSITVTGKGELQVKPDTAQIQAGVVTTAATAATALDENSALMRRVLSGLTTFGIPATDVQTSNFSIIPQYHRPAPRTQEEARIIGYQVVNQVTVVVRALERLGEALDTLVRLGANQIHGVQFAVSNPAALLDQAWVAAVQEARRKAELLSQTAGAKLGRVLSIQETSAAMPRIAFARQAETAASVPIAPGSETLSVHLTIVFALE